METKEINKIKVRKVKLPDKSDLPVKGCELFENPYSNIFICAKKHSGKTVLVSNILKNCIDKRTKVFIISPTVERDSTYKVIRERLNRKGNEVYVYDDLDKGKTIDEIIENAGFREESEESYSEDDIFELKPKKKKKRIKYLVPEIIIICDDLGSEMRHKSLSNLLKRNRHYKSMVIMLGQYPQDIDIPAWKNLDRCILFKGHSQDKLKIIHDRLDLNISFEKFLQMYKDATNLKYAFLYVDAENNKFRNNFNREYIL